MFSREEFIYLHGMLADDPSEFARGIRAKLDAMAAQLAPEPASNRFCVIGPDAINRTWFDTADKAAAHGEDLLRRQTSKLLVVQALESLTRETPVVRRRLT